MAETDRKRAPGQSRVEVDKDERRREIIAANERLAERAKAVKPPPPGEVNDEGKSGAAVNAETAAAAEAAETTQAGERHDESS